MTSEFKQRSFTAISLILLVALMFVSKIVYLFISLVVFSLSFVEFSKITSKIFKKKHIYKLICNMIFLIYISLFLLILIFAINDIYLKIILFSVLMVCIASDIGGIFFGKIFKGPKLTKISPNKTISGSIGSFILSIASSIFLLGLILDLNLSYKIYFGFLISLSVQIGDLFISYLKRKAVIKDTGKILPGHGGLLDRIDGILLGIPVGLTTMLVLITK